MINTSVDLVLRDIPNLETIIEDIKRESTKWKFERQYEYFILRTPLWIDAIPVYGFNSSVMT